MKGSGATRKIVWAVVVLVFALGLGLSACGSGDDGSEKTDVYKDRIVEISELPTSGIKFYNVIVSSEVDWAEVKSEERQGIAKYGVNEAIKLAESAGIALGGYAIMGSSEDGDVLFQYNGETSIRIFVDGKPAEDISL
jgi:hypothetical protein